MLRPLGTIILFIESISFHFELRNKISNIGKALLFSRFHEMVDENQWFLCFFDKYIIFVKLQEIQNQIDIF